MGRTILVAIVCLAAGALTGYYVGRHAAVPAEPSPDATSAPLPAAGIGLNGTQPAAPSSTSQASQCVAGEDAAKIAVEMVFPGWEVSVKEHSSDWRTATVLASEPEGKLTLALDLEWDDEVADYVIARAAVHQAGGESAQKTPIPPALISALKANPKLSSVEDATMTLERLTSADAVIVASSGSHKWRVYLKKAGSRWVVKNAKRLTP